MSRTAQVKPDRNHEPLVRLLAAEAEYLRARGWVPYSTTGGGVVWDDPQNHVPNQFFRQDVAVGMQRQREPEEARYKV